MLWNVEGAVAEPHRIVALQQQPLFRKEPERPNEIARSFVEGGPALIMLLLSNFT